MNKFFKIRIILPVVLIILLVIQVFRIDKTNPSQNPDIDYLYIVKPPAEIASLIKDGCYDCHSNETSYPWYSNIAPFSWLIKSHIIEGRDHLNFSEWGNYQAGRRGNKQDKCKEMLVKNEMPISLYKLMHSSAKFTNEQKAMLITWFTNE
jgi:hypothetical protein